MRCSDASWLQAQEPHAEFASSHTAEPSSSAQEGTSRLKEEASSQATEGETQDSKESGWQSSQDSQSEDSSQESSSQSKAPPKQSLGERIRSVLEVVKREVSS